MRTILLIEDALDLANVIRRLLEADGYHVEHAADGLLGLQLTLQLLPDAVILDWMLPKLDGLEVLRRLRASSDVPVLMLTARGEEMDRVVGLEVGADDYLVKPFSHRELAARVRALLRRADLVRDHVQADRSDSRLPLIYGPLCLDPDAHLVALSGQPLDVTRLEFDLLHLLLRNPGRAFSRDYLLEAVWHEDSVAGDRSVDNTILRLRKKLGPLGDVIETLYGVGYRLQPAPPGGQRATA
jgi:DNA-binding response OmpR family regulator